MALETPQGLWWLQGARGWTLLLQPNSHCKHQWKSNSSSIFPEAAGRQIPPAEQWLGKAAECSWFGLGQSGSSQPCSWAYLSMPGKEQFPGTQRAALSQPAALKPGGEIMSWTRPCLECQEDAVIPGFLCFASRLLQSWTLLMQRIFINEVTVAGRAPLSPGSQWLL